MILKTREKLPIEELKVVCTTLVELGREQTSEVNTSSVRTRSAPTKAGEERLHSLLSHKWMVVLRKLYRITRVEKYAGHEIKSPCWNYKLPW